MRIGTSTEEEDFIPDSIHNTTPHRTPKYLLPLTPSPVMTGPSPLSLQICQNTNATPATFRIQIANATHAEVVATPPVFTTLALTTIMRTGNSSSATQKTPSSRRSHHLPNHKMRRVHLSHRSIQQSLSGTQRSQSSKSV